MLRLKKKKNGRKIFVFICLIITAVLVVHVLQDSSLVSVLILHLGMLAAVLVVVDHLRFHMILGISLRLQVWLLTRLALQLTALQPSQRLQQTLPSVLCVCAHQNNIFRFYKRIVKDFVTRMLFLR
jgi:hypothetical protein